MIKKAVILTVSLILSLIFANVTFAEDGWDAALTIKVLNAENKLSFGQRPDATDGIDGRYDVPALLSGDVMAYFLLDETKYWRDIKAITNGESKTWHLWIESSLNGEIVEIEWTRGLLPVNSIFIDNETGAVIDMKTQGSYTYPNNGQRRFRIETAQ